jgi:hypothetical protein
MAIEVKVEAVIGDCTNFTSEPKGKTETLSIVISPLKVSISEDESRLAVTSGCNLWKSCHNQGCWYSIAARDRGKDTRQ